MADNDRILDSPEDFDRKADEIAERSRDLELFVLLLFADRINQIGRTKKPLTQLEKELDLDKIAKKVHLYEILQKADINRLLEQVIRDAYSDAKIYYDHRQMKYLLFEENKPLKSILEEFKRNVLNDDRFRTQAFMIRNPKNRKELIATPLSEAYNKVINEAANQATNGVGDYQSAIRRTVKDLTDNGMKTVEYDTESGEPYVQRTEAAVKRNILDNIRDINQKTQDELGKQYGADGKEITVHEHSAPDHEPVQGRQFTNEEYEKLQNAEPFEDYNGRKYKPIQRAIGTLNCRHFTYSVILGVNKPNFTEEELDESIKRNQEGYTDPSGKHRTLYECTQEQRRLERLIRRAKEGQVVARQSGDIELARNYQYQVNKYTEQYKQFSSACGLPTHSENTRISGYQKIKI